MRSTQPHPTWRAFISVCILSILLGGCSQATPSPTPTSPPIPTPTQALTPYPTRTPTLPPPATDENPLILGIVSETNNPKAAAAADEIVKQIVRITNFKVQSRIYPSYQQLLADLQLGKVHIVFLQPFTYIWAKQKGWVQPALLANHFGVYQYGAQFLANISGKYTIYFDPASGRNTMDPATALKQFANKKPCWIDQTSAPGYVLPLGFLTEQGVKVSGGAFTLSNTATVRALYITGICDFGVTYSTVGDPRTSTAVTQDLTDVMNRIIVIYQIDPMIPNLNISLLSSLPKEMRGDLTFALQSLTRTDTGKANYSAANDYEIADLKPLDDTVYDPLRNYLKLSGINIETLIGK